MSRRLNPPSRFGENVVGARHLIEALKRRKVASNPCGFVGTLSILRKLLGYSSARQPDEAARETVRFFRFLALANETAHESITRPRTPFISRFARCIGVTALTSAYLAHRVVFHSSGNASMCRTGWYFGGQRPRCLTPRASSWSMTSSATASSSVSATWASTRLRSASISATSLCSRPMAVLAALENSIR